jgi:HEPN domain-containing protein
MVPLDLAEFRRWRAEAERAYENARLLADAGSYNWACFSAEQAAQLAVKALLHAVGGGPWGHDLTRLGAQLEAAAIAVPGPIADAFRRLSLHYIPTRYADAHPGGSAFEHYGRAQADEALADARAVLVFVDGTVGPSAG